MDGAYSATVDTISIARDTDGIDLGLILIAGTLGMLLLAIAIIVFVVMYQKRLIKQQVKMQEQKAVHQKEMLQATIDTQEKERRRIARDLHDDIGATLSAVKLGMNYLHRQLDKESEAATYSEESKSLLDEAISNVRRLSKELLPATLEEFGLPYALDELCRKLDGASAMEVKFSGDQEGEDRFDPKLELGLYRAVQESINNAMKHSEAKLIAVELQKSNDSLTLTVSDDGVGFDVEEVANRVDKGLGLMNIESRVSMVESTVKIDSSPSNGTKVFIHVKTD